MEFIKWATRPSAVQRETPIVFYMTLNGLKKFYVIPLDIEKSDYYVEKESYFALLKKVFTEVMKDPAKHIANYDGAGDIFIKKAINVFENLNSSPEKLLKAYKEYFDYLIEYSIYFIATFSAEEIIVPKIEKLFPDKMSLITSPGRPLMYQKMQKSLFEKSLEEVKKEYGWMNLYNYQEEEYDINYFKELKGHLSKEQVDKVFKEVEKNQIEFTDFIKTIKDKELKEEIILMHEYAFIKTDRVDYWRKAQAYVKYFFKKLADENFLTLKETTNFTLEEIEDLLLNKKLPDKRKLKLRAEKKFVTDIEKRKVNLIYDEKEISKIKALVEENISHQTEFKGVIACNGYAKGTARIITDKTQLNKIKSGDIIVSIWTTPDFLTAMKLSAGIITEEGGLTSHAAVTSRELNKPCVMNIKNATKVLKDGDMIELDADKGIIRILEKMLNKWFLHARRNASLHHLSFIICGFNGKGWLPVVDFYLDNYIIIGIPGKGGFIYLDNQELKNKKFKEIQASVDKNNNFISDFRKRTDEIFGNLFSWCDKIDKSDLVKLSKEELEALYKGYIKSVLASPLITVQVYGIEAMIDPSYKIIKTIESKLRALGKEGDLARYKEIFLANDGETVAFTERKDFYNICSSLDKTEVIKLFNNTPKEIVKGLKKIPEIDNLIEYHIKKYSWLNTEYLGNPWSKEKWIALFRETLLDKSVRPEQKLKELLRSSREFSDRKKKAINELGLPKDVIYSINVLGEFLAQRDWTKGYFAKSLLSFHKLLHEIAKRMQTSFDDILQYSYSEILEYLEKGNKLSREEISKRTNEGYVFVFKDRKFSFSSGKGAIKKILAGEGIDDPTEEVKQEKEIRGLSASRGKTRGKARVIDSASKISEFRDGEILVTYMTTIEFTSLFRKARAVITDEGGMSCHAAIVSREFKLPCIVGTKTGTRVIKTGDLVEVDADKGIIRILEKNEK